MSTSATTMSVTAGDIMPTDHFGKFSHAVTNNLMGVLGVAETGFAFAKTYWPQHAKECGQYEKTASLGARILAPIYLGVSAGTTLSTSFTVFREAGWKKVKSFCQFAHDAAETFIFSKMTVELGETLGIFPKISPMMVRGGVVCEFFVAGYQALQNICVLSTRVTKLNAYQADLKTRNSYELLKNISAIALTAIAFVTFPHYAFVVFALSLICFTASVAGYIKNMDLQHTAVLRGLSVKG